MGVTYIEGVVIGPGGEAEVRFLVDGGATYTLLPEKTWRKIGLAPRRRVTFTLADGTAIERNVSECFIKPPQGEGHSPVILGRTRRSSALRRGHTGDTGTHPEPVHQGATAHADAFGIRCLGFVVISVGEQ